MMSDETTAEQKQPGMVISLGGVLKRAADRVASTRDMNHLLFPLEQLHEHLEQLRENPERVHEFFKLWVK
jgi:hypothetical protein